MLCTITPNPTAILYPRDYQGKSENYDECLTLSDFPQSGYTIDTYRAWLAQNSNSQKVGLLATLSSGVIGAGSTAGAFATAAGLWATNPIGASAIALAGGLSGVNTLNNASRSVSELMAERKDRQVGSKQMAGNNTGDIMTALKQKQFEIECMCVTPEYAKSIDDYFMLYGYKVNEVKIPSLNNRPHYTYCKTVGCNITGNLPQSSIKKINAIFDNGITHWVNIDEIGDYSLNNAPA